MGRARPGFAPERLARLARAVVDDANVDLSGLVVLTEAATGPYAAIAALAALAGARWVYAYARDTAHGTRSELARQTIAAAKAASVENRVEILVQPPITVAPETNIVTNSRGLRPLDAPFVERLRPGAVIALMAEPWALQPGDLDVDACNAAGVRLVAVDFCDTHRDLQPHLGNLAVRLLNEAGFSVPGTRVAVLCPTVVAAHVQPQLAAAGADVRTAGTVDALPKGDTDVVLVASAAPDQPLGPTWRAGDLVARVGRVPVAQLWGHVDRAGLRRLGIPVWPPDPPTTGQLGLPLWAIGPDAMVRRHALGLRAAGIVHETFMSKSGGNNGSMPCCTQASHMSTLA